MITIEQIEQQERIKDQAQDKANEERNKWFLMIAQYNEENEVQYEDRPQKNTKTSQALVRSCTKFINVYFQSALGGAKCIYKQLNVLNAINTMARKINLYLYVLFVEMMIQKRQSTQSQKVICIKRLCKAKNQKMSKGSQPRPHDKDKFNKNFDLIFNKRKKQKGKKNK